MENDQTTYFYKCEYCGYLTEIKHDNHIWCYNCTKQFTNYYKKWKQENYSKDLEGYKKEMCRAFKTSELQNKVELYNKKVEITSPSKDQIMRRTYLKQGISLDRAYTNNWEAKNIKNYVVYIIILAMIILGIALLAT